MLIPPNRFQRPLPRRTILLTQLKVKICHKHGRSHNYLEFGNLALC